MGKDDNGKTKSPNYTILSPEEVANGKTTEIAGLEITGEYQNFVALASIVWSLL